MGLTGHIVGRASGKPGKRAAFTLIELLVVTAILALVVGAVGACLAGGIRVWDVARRFNRHEADAFFGFRLMRKDISGALQFESAPFRGEREACSFTGVTFVSPQGGSDGAVPRLARIRYYLDRDRRNWCRAVSAFEWEDEPPESVEVLVSGVGDVSLQYGASPASSRHRSRQQTTPDGWSDAWEDPTNLPAVVEVELWVGAATTREAMTQWFTVPLAGEETP